MEELERQIKLYRRGVITYEELLEQAENLGIDNENDLLDLMDDAEE